MTTPLPQAQKTILKTLAYYQALSKLSLTVLEIQKYLRKEKGVSHAYSLFEIQKELNKLEEYGLVTEQNGFWVLSVSVTNEPGLSVFENRITNSKYAALKWKKFAKTGRFLPYIPFIRSVAVTGSTALSNAKEKSDIDVLITSKGGAIWSTRFLVTTVSLLLKRRRYAKKIENRLCFNQYLTQDAINLGPETVDDTVNSIKIKVWDNKIPANNEALLSLQPSKILILLKNTVEKILKTLRLDKLFETFIAKLQIAKIQNNPTDYPKELEQPSLNSANLIFYYPRVKITEKKYKEILSSLRNPDTIRTHV
ncbi:MAG: nucleotidyltransferase domain-containing protein [Candidatus Spechtbacterales bacterium]